jgi:predicted permease
MAQVSPSTDPERAMRLQLQPGGQGLTRRRQEQREPLALLAGVGALAQLVACASVAGLLVARGRSRRRDLGIRLALGATRGRLVRQLFVESLLLAAASGALGVGVAIVAKDALAAALLPNATLALDLDVRRFAFSGAISLATAALFGLLPARRVTRVDVIADLNGHGSTASRGRPTLAQGLVVAQIALSLVLLVGAGLLLRTAQNLGRADIGFDTTSVHLFSIDAPNAGDRSRGLDRTRRLLDRLAGLPEVESAGVALHYLIDDNGEKRRVAIEGHTLPDEAAVADTNWVDGDFFRTLAIPLHRGRLVSAEDDAHAPPVVVVNEAFARRYFPGESAIGRAVSGRRIVGIVGDTTYGSLRDAAPPTMFVPLFQEPMDARSYCVRLHAGVDAAAIAARLRAIVREIEPAAAMSGLTPASARITAATTPERALAGISGFFAGLALLLASLGLYGLIAYDVARRTREIGIRMAMGATRAGIARLALEDGLRLATAGVALGTAAALAATRLMRGVLYGVTPTDVPTFAGTVALLLLGVAAACAWPAQRAARIEPTVALRHD